MSDLLPFCGHTALSYGLYLTEFFGTEILFNQFGFIGYASFTDTIVVLSNIIATTSMRNRSSETAGQDILSNTIVQSLP